jgi:hypothetical protein
MSGHQLSTLDAQLADNDLLILVTGKLKVLNSQAKRMPIKWNVADAYN